MRGMLSNKLENESKIIDLHCLFVSFFIIFTVIFEK